MESTRSNFIWDAIDEDLKEGHYANPTAICISGTAKR